MSRMHPTAYLEHHADVYAAHLMHKHGVTLDQYLADPARYEHLLGAPSSWTACHGTTCGRSSRCTTSATRNAVALRAAVIARCNRPNP